MLTFKHMAFELTDSGNVYMSLTNDRGEQPYGASFCWSAEEWRRLVFREGPQVFIDGYHLCDAQWTDWLLFVDTDQISYQIPAGKAECRYYRMHAPRQVWAQIDARLQSAPKEQGRPRVEIAKEERESWLRAYGQGTGKVSVLWHEQIDVRFGADVERDSEGDLARYLEHWTAIARNSTWRAEDCARLEVSRDGRGYYVCVYGPKGGRVMNGGWINHGTDSEPSWSSHT